MLCYLMVWASSVIVGHPLDTVKARLQVGKGYGNTFNCIFTIYRNEHVAGFYKGMSFPLASISVYNSVVFGVFSNTQRFISEHWNRSPGNSPYLLDLTIASSLTGFISVGIGGPVDLVKIRLQMQTEPLISEIKSIKDKSPFHQNPTVYKGPIHCLTSIIKQDGFVGMYRGAGAMILRDVPGYCLYFIPYTYLCEWLTEDCHTAPSASSVWIAGGIAGAISWGTATPMDVVKSRLQADGVHSEKYKGVTDCIVQCYNKEGLKVFFRGISVNAMRGVPMSAAMFLTYELSLKAMKKAKVESDT
ncbi:solute carrier family 25 member 48 isoform X2 [Pelobates fuscus]|uniref:solute carrier family 25 member 48 isoform X2 n=1 Tax=Pelobates fuscus TaxID=191477 RepID=UPI002FE430E6